MATSASTHQNVFLKPVLGRRVKLRKLARLHFNDARHAYGQTGLNPAPKLSDAGAEHNHVSNLRKERFLSPPLSHSGPIIVTVELPNSS